MVVMMMKVGLPFSLLSIWLSFGSADAMSLKEPQICYILDAVLLIYGIVLTVLYCRMKMRSKQAEKLSGVSLVVGGHTIYLSIYLSICLSVYLSSISLSVYLSIYHLSVYLSIYLSVICLHIISVSEKHYKME
uniref:Fc fragment of IgE, high affinity I, receptor for; gamma polypeptide n=1 Tax=Cyprinus carpio TaxID=7962 RepID=A0A8C2F3R9_CYPCA